MKWDRLGFKSMLYLLLAVSHNSGNFSWLQSPHLQRGVPVLLKELLYKLNKITYEAYCIIPRLLLVSILFLFSVLGMSFVV
jgi:hypothetical protein